MAFHQIGMLGAKAIVHRLGGRADWHASASLEGSKAATGDPACLVSQTRTAPSRPQVASSASPHPSVCAAQHEGLLLLGVRVKVGSGLG